MTVYSNVTELIERTLLVKLNHIAGGNATIIAEPEFYNPTNPVKNHIGVAVTETAETSGGLKPGGTIVEGTSGNTNIALVMVGAAKGYKAVLAVPETMPLERRALLRAYGAELVLTPGLLGMKGAVTKTEETAGGRGGVLARQFVSPTNLAVHRHTATEEIWVDTDDRVDIFVAGVGAGGVVSGIGQVLKKHESGVKIIVIEPAESPILSSDQPGPHKIQDLGANFVPGVLDRDMINEIVTRNIGQSIEFARAAATQEGLLADISSGAALFAAVGVVNRPEDAGKTIVVMLPDFGEHYLSTVLLEDFVDAWSPGREKWIPGS